MPVVWGRDQEREVPPAKCLVETLLILVAALGPATLVL